VRAWRKGEEDHRKNTRKRDEPGKFPKKKTKRTTSNQSPILKTEGLTWGKGQFCGKNNLRKEGYIKANNKRKRLGKE